LQKDEKGLYLPLKILGLTVKRKRFPARAIEPVRAEQPHTGPVDSRTIEGRFRNFMDEDGERPNAYETKRKPDSKSEGFIQFYHISSLDH
jgi:hypothetical protein